MDIFELIDEGKAIERRLKRATYRASERAGGDEEVLERCVAYIRRLETFYAEGGRTIVEKRTSTLTVEQVNELSRLVAIISLAQFGSNEPG